MSITRRFVIWFFVLCLSCPASAFAGIDRDTGRFMFGFQRVILSAFQMPFQMIQGTINGPIGVGTVQGIVGGTIQTVTDMVGGVFDMAAASAPYAKYAALAL